MLNRLDPLTYAVDPMRRLVFNHLDISAAARQTLDPGVTWWGWHLPSLVEAGMVLRAGPGDDGRRELAVLTRRMKLGAGAD